MLDESSKKLTQIAKDDARIKYIKIQEECLFPRTTV